jgi:hypothetical protein
VRWRIGMVGLERCGYGGNCMPFAVFTAEISSVKTRLLFLVLLGERLVAGCQRGMPLTEDQLYRGRGLGAGR